MQQKVYNVLFLCTGNSCRSVISEATFNHLAPAGLKAISAGSQPAGKLHPRANIHQKAKWTGVIDGVTVDINNVYSADWGQWTPGRRGPGFTLGDLGSSQLSSRFDWRALLPK